ncbi:MAG: hypothetical protein ACOY5F_13195 [Pseudomonadota bacterium]
MMRSLKRKSENAEAAARLKAWTRHRFSLTPECAILVAEVTCGLPGCPPIETVIAFWSSDTRHSFKVFKPLAEVVEDDLPPSWMREALMDDNSAYCC